MGTVSSGGTRFVVGLALVLGAAGALGMGCFPSYVYDGNLGAGGTGSAGTMSTGPTMSSTTTSTGGGATTGTTGTAGSASTSASSTGGPTPCSQRDCSNPACADTFKCVPTAPTGWTGFYRLYDGPAAAPGCDATWPMTAYDGNATIDAPDATCNCACGAPTGMTCAVGGAPDQNVSGTVDEIIVTDAACGGTITCGGGLEVLPTWNGACYGPDGFNAGATNCGPNSMTCTKAGSAPCNVSLQAAALKITGGTCAPSGSPMPMITKVSWGEYGEACGGAMPGTGCLSGETCLPIPDPAFVSGVCVMQVGNIPNCPAVFTDNHVFFDPSATMDTRGCTGTCSCDAPAGGSCSATITVYSDQSIDTCNSLVATLKPTTAAGDCVAIAGNPAVGSRKAVFSPVTGATCDGSGGTATGMATAETPTTFCCIP